MQLTSHLEVAEGAVKMLLISMISCEFDAAGTAAANDVEYWSISGSISKHLKGCTRGGVHVLLIFLARREDFFLGQLSTREDFPLYEKQKLDF